MYEIPLNFNNPYFSRETTLFGQSFCLEFEKIERGDFWVMHVYNTQEQPLALGIKLISKWPLFSHSGIVLMMLDDDRLIAYETV